MCNLKLIHDFQGLKVSQGKVRNCILNRQGGKLYHLLMAYLLSRPLIFVPKIIVMERQLLTLSLMVAWYTFSGHSVDYLSRSKCSFENKLKVLQIVIESVTSIQ